MADIIVTRMIPGIEELDGRASHLSVWVNPSRLALSQKELLERAKTARAILVVGDKIDAYCIAAMPQLRVLSNYGVGLDNIDVQAAHARGVTVTNLLHEVTYSTAELGMTLILACMRRLREADQLVRNHNPFQWTAFNAIGRNLHRKTLGIYGFGRIGQRLGAMAQAFGMHIVYANRSRKPAAEAALGARYLSLAEVLSLADVLSIHLPGGPDTHHAIGAAELAMLKKDAVLVNTSRGTVVDEKALVTALQSGALAGAGLDVYENEPTVEPALLAMDNVLLTPHVGTTTWETRHQMTRGALENIYRLLEQE